MRRVVGSMPLIFLKINLAIEKNAVQSLFMKLNITQNEIKVRKSGFSPRATLVFKSKVRYSRKEKHKEGF